LHKRKFWFILKLIKKIDYQIQNFVMSLLQKIFSVFSFSVLALSMFLSFVSIPSLAVEIPNACPTKGGCAVFKDPQNAVKNSDQGTIAGFIIYIAGMLTFVGVALAVLFMVYGGILFVTDDGSGSNAEKGKKILVQASIGLVVIIVAYTIVALISGFLQGNIFSGFTGNKAQTISGWLV
jgi:hypothetical protein